MLTRHGLSSVREPARPSTRRSNRPAISIAVARQEQMRSAIEAASPISQHRDADEHQGKSRRLGICCAWNPGRSLRSSANAKKREGLPAAKSLSLVTKSRWRPSARSGPKASPSSFSGKEAPANPKLAGRADTNSLRIEAKAAGGDACIDGRRGTGEILPRSVRQQCRLIQRWRDGSSAGIDMNGEGFDAIDISRRAVCWSPIGDRHILLALSSIGDA